MKKLLIIFFLLIASNCWGFDIGNNTDMPQGCTNGQVPKYNTTTLKWDCAADSTGDITSVGNCTTGACPLTTATFGAGGTITWTFDTGIGTDPTMTCIDASCTFSNKIIATGGIDAGPSANPTIVLKDSDATAGDDNSTIDVNCTNVGNGTEDCDMTVKTQIAGTLTSVIAINADGSITFGLPLIGDITGALTGNADTATAAGKSTNLVGGNGTTLLGSMPYQSGTDTTTMLAPNVTTTKKFLRETGDGTNGTAPAWDTIIAGDVPTLNQNTTGYAGGIAITSQAAGDTFYATSATAIARIAKGTAFQLFQMNSGGTASEWTSQLSLASLDLSSGDYLKIPTGSAPTTDAAGKIGIDTTANQLKYYGTAAKVFDPRRHKDATFKGPVSGDKSKFSVPYGMTVTGVSCLVDAATSAVLDVQECDVNGANCTTILSSSITCAATHTTGTVSDTAIAANNYVFYSVGTVTGTVGFLYINFDYTVTGE